jgi:hypothetical protein
MLRLRSALLATVLLSVCIAQHCQTTADCSAAGSCILPQGACDCEAGFSGATCNFLDNRTRVPIKSGFRMASYHVWGSQVVLDAGTWHMAASIYPADLNFDKSWLYTAQIAHATSSTPLGPFEFQSIILPYNTPDAWDRSVMNPKLLRAPIVGSEVRGEQSTWLLYYVGDTYPGPTPNASNPPPQNQSVAQSSQMIGLATAPAPGGPYLRTGAPVLQPRPGSWDERMVTNPAVVPFGGNTTALLMVYKGSSPAGTGAQTRVCLGVASTPHWSAPFVRLRDDPILPCPMNSFYSEDPTVWVRLGWTGTRELGQGGG